MSPTYDPSVAPIGTPEAAAESFARLIPVASRRVRLTGEFSVVFAERADGVVDDFRIDIMQNGSVRIESLTWGGTVELQGQTWLAADGGKVIVSALTPQRRCQEPTFSP